VELVDALTEQFVLAANSGARLVAGAPLIHNANANQSGAKA